MRMAYVNQELKARIAPQVKQVLAKWGLKGSLSVNHHSTLVLRIRSGKLNFIANCNKNTKINYPGSPMATTCIGVNRYHLNSQFDGACLQCVQELMDALNQFN